MATTANFPGDGTATFVLDNGTEAVYDPSLDPDFPWSVKVHHVLDPAEDIDTIHAFAVEQGWA